MPQSLIVVPATPILIPDIVGDDRGVLEPILDAADRALSGIGPSVAVVSSRDVWRDEQPRSPRPVGAVGDAVGLVSGIDAPQSLLGWAVARYLLERVGVHRGVRYLVADQLAVPGPPAGGADLPEPPSSDRSADPLNVDAVVFTADGSAAIGSGTRNTESGESFDGPIAAALRSGRLSDLVDLTDTVSAVHGCTTGSAWRALAQVAAGQRIACRQFGQWSPNEVTYFVGRLDRLAGPPSVLIRV